MSRLKDLFKKTTNVQEPETEESKVSGEETSGSENTPSVPEGLWVKCPKCGELLYKEDVVKNDFVCPKCKGYFRIKAKTRIRLVADKGSFKEWCTGLHAFNPLDYPEYEEKISRKRPIWRRPSASERPGLTAPGLCWESVTPVFSWGAWDMWWEKRSPVLLSRPQRKSCRSSCFAVPAGPECRRVWYL